MILSIGLVLDLFILGVGVGWSCCGYGCGWICLWVYYYDVGGFGEFYV